MAAIAIRTGRCPRVNLTGARGACAEIVNKSNCGASNFVGMLRWLGAGERFAAESASDEHQLIYLMEGSGVMTLDSKEYHVSKGAGVYLGPNETVSVRQAGKGFLKLFHLIVLQVSG